MDTEQTNPTGQAEQAAPPKLNASHAIALSEFQAKQKDGQLVIRPKKPERVNQNSDFWLKREQVDLLLSAARSLRDRCLLKLLYFGMLRRNEARSLKIEDCDFTAKRLNLKITKRSKPRTVPIMEPGVWDDLRLSVGSRKAGWVFASKSKDGRLSPKAINDIVAQSAKAAALAQPNPNLRRMNPHILRHSFARHLRRQTPPIAIEVLQKLLGHSSVRTTMDIYGTADLEFMEDELRRCTKERQAGG